MGAFKTKLLDFLFPRRCPFCGRVVEEDLPCPICQRELPWLVGREAEGSAEFLDRHASALRYQGGAAEAVRRMKFGRRPAGAKVLGVLTAQCARDHFQGKFDLITWVPLSPKGLRERGFDQAELLAREVAADQGMALTSLFAKKNGTLRQSSLHGTAARRANVLGAFSLTDPEAVRGKGVLIVDDVVTSGATLSACAALLRMAGAEAVFAVTLTRAGDQQV